MRLWMTDPEIMCDKHLMGEHFETHMFYGSIKLKRKMNGFVDNNKLEIKSLKKRHDELAKEMIRRGFKHNSELKDDLNLSYLDENLINKEIDKVESLKDLVSRCLECSLRYLKKYGENDEEKNVNRR